MPERYVHAIVPDELWAKVKPVLPQPKPLSESRRARAPDRTVLAGILFVVRTGIRWMDLPLELGCCGNTCRRRLKEWHASGVWAQILEVLMRQLPDAQKLEWSRATLDPADIAARKHMSRPPAGKLLELVYATTIGSFEVGRSHDGSGTAGHPEPASGPDAWAERLADWPSVKYPTGQGRRGASGSSSSRTVKLSRRGVTPST
ncbi:MAG: transposase [Janthinobacterium lividum]